MASICFDVEDYLGGVDLKVLQKEIIRRIERDRKAKAADGGIEVWTPPGLADDLRTAFYTRNASRFELLLTVLQPHEATRGLKRAKEAA